MLFDDALDCTVRLGQRMPVKKSNSNWRPIGGCQQGRFPTLKLAKAKGKLFIRKEFFFLKRMIV